MAQVQNFDDPLTLYKGGDTRVVHSQKEFNQAVGEGFTPRYSYQEYPKVLYHDGGFTKLVHSKDEEDEHLATGEYSLQAHKDQRHLDRPKPVEQADAFPVDVQKLHAIVAEKETENEELKERVDELEAKFAELLAAVSGKGKSKAKAAQDESV